MKKPAPLYGELTHINRFVLFLYLSFLYLYLHTVLDLFSCCSISSGSSPFCQFPDLLHSFSCYSLLLYSLLSLHAHSITQYRAERWILLQVIQIYISYFSNFDKHRQSVLHSMRGADVVTVLSERNRFPLFRRLSSIFLVQLL
jgi:hypothetical protein